MSREELLTVAEDYCSSCSGSDISGDAVKVRDARLKIVQSAALGSPPNGRMRGRQPGTKRRRIGSSMFRGATSGPGDDRLFP